MKKYKFLFLFLLIAGCGIEKPYEPQHLNPPMNLIAYPGNEKIYIKFYATNQESEFIGFNIYISKSSSVRNQKINPVKNPDTGGLPTISMTVSQIAENNTVCVEIDRDSNDDYLENGTTYYIIARAVSRKGYKSDPSNEASTTPRPESSEDVILYNGEGFNLQKGSKSTPYNFTLNIDSKVYIKGENGTYIMNMGYYSDWREVNEAPEAGYIEPGLPVEISKNYIIIFKDSGGNYSKIYITDTGDNFIKFKWAYQTVKGNRSI